VFGIETTADPVAIHGRIGYLPGEFTLYDRLTGGQTIDYFAHLRGGAGGEVGGGAGGGGGAGAGAGGGRGVNRVDPAYRDELVQASTWTRPAGSGSTPRATSRRSAW
jgi:hypothetical protein